MDGTPRRFGQQSAQRLTRISAADPPKGHLCDYPGHSGQTDSVMTTDNSTPNSLTARSVVLLVFFMPSNLANRPQRVELTALANAIQTQLGSLIRVLRVDEISHPDVVKSFAITQLPAFVLLRRGVELWRQQGLTDEAALVGLIRKLVTANSVND